MYGNCPLDFNKSQFNIYFFYIYKYKMLDLDKLTSKKLKDICRKENIPGYSGLRKAELVRHVKTHKLNLLINEGIEQLSGLV